MSDAPYTLYVEASNNVIRPFVIDMGAAREAAVRDTSTLRQGRALAEQIALQLQNAFPLSQARSREVIEALESMLKFMNQLSSGYMAGLVLRVPGTIEEKASATGSATSSAHLQNEIHSLAANYDRRLKAQESQYRTNITEAQNQLRTVNDQLAKEQARQQQYRNTARQLQETEAALQDAREQLKDALDQYQQILPQLQALTQRVTASEESYQALKKERDALALEKSELKVRYDALEQQYKQSELQLKNVTTAEARERGQRERLSENNAELQRQVEDLEQQIEKLTAPSGINSNGDKSLRKERMKW